MTVVRSGLPLPPAQAGEEIVSDDELRRRALSGQLLLHTRRYRDACLLTERLSTSGRPMLAWALWLLARRRRCIRDLQGAEREITLPLLARWSWQLLRETFDGRSLLRRTIAELNRLDASGIRRPPPVWNAAAPLVYLRTDLSFGVRAGGSVGHVAGVLNELAEADHRPIFVTTADIPTLGRDIEVHHLAVPERFWNFRELPTFVMNDVVFAEALRAIGDRAVSLVYQRYSLNSYAGLRLARRLGVPFVLEYNGSEIWMSRHWGRPLKFEALASRIELANVNGADLVVVVSRTMRDELTARGADPTRILVNPNAVDPERYSPDVDGSAVRRRYGIDAQTLVGFISTFQPWHGAVVLAQAFVALLTAHPEHRSRVRLLMIGSGPEADAAKRVIAAAGLDDAVHFTGLVEQDDGPRHLAACDVLVSPHVPNADGSPFFGSPTKLFEYMAMGKGIVASNLGQIGEVLRHGETAWLVPPADASALAGALDRLVRDPELLRTLGAAARSDAIVHHTWRAHVGRTLDAVAARIHADAA